MATFDEICKRNKQMAERLSKATGVTEDLAMNVLLYAKKLSPPDQPDVIDKVVFIAQLHTRFGMSSMFLINLIYESMTVKGLKNIKLEEYAQMICAFLTEKIDVKIDYVFRVYDFKRDGILDYKEAHTLLMSTIILTSDDQEGEDQLKDLIDLVMTMTDINHDGMVTFEEFSQFVKGNILCMELLGRVLPPPMDIDAFVNLIQGKLPHEILKLFLNERRICLQEPILNELQQDLYPIKLDLP